MTDVPISAERREAINEQIAPGGDEYCRVGWRQAITDLRDLLREVERLGARKAQLEVGVVMMERAVWVAAHDSVGSIGWQYCDEAARKVSAIRETLSPTVAALSASAPPHGESDG